MKFHALFCLPLILLSIISCSKDHNTNSRKETEVPQPSLPPNTVLSPYEANPFYWQYNGKPVMLLGGSKDDNLFQIANLEAHLADIQQSGGNYIRNTMSSRDEDNLQPFVRLADGRYDLDQWNEAYWQQFEKFLSLTEEYDIIVQLEFWDQWDHVGELWDTDPWNPDHNVNYKTSNTILKGDGGYMDVNHYSADPHHLFLTVPNLENDEIVLAYQKKFVDKILSYTFQYDHVLYTITNELFNQHSIEWSYFWVNYIHAKGQKKAKRVYITEMFQQSDIQRGAHERVLEEPQIFDFLDISQNSGKSNQVHWDQLQWTRNQLVNAPRPINHTKTYGSDQVGWTDGSQHGIERFWRNIIGGAASVRFHRPPSGLGLSMMAQHQLQSARLLLEEFDIFNADPDAESAKLAARGEDEAYLTSVGDRQFAIYFPQGGSLELDLTSAENNYSLRWLQLNTSTWQPSNTVNGGQWVKLQTPTGVGWVALLLKK